MVYPKNESFSYSFFDMKEVYNYKYKVSNIGIYIFGGIDGAQVASNNLYLIRGRRSTRGQYLGN